MWVLRNEAEADRQDVAFPGGLHLGRVRRTSQGRGPHSRVRVRLLHHEA